MSNANKVTDQVVVVDLNINIWSGQRKLDIADIRLGQGGELPPEKVANLGNKKIVDPKSLNPFHRIKTKARRYLADHGMPFLGGWACPAAKYAAIQARLKEFEAEYDGAKVRFLHDYDRTVESWVADNPEYANEIRRGVMHVKDVERRIDFSFETFKLQPAAEGEEEKLERKVARLGDDLLDEVAATAAKFAETLVGRTEIASTTSITLKGIRDKVEGLAFLNGNLQPVAELLSETIRGYELNREGRNVVAPFIYQVQAVVLTLADRDRIERFARGEISIGDAAKAVERNAYSDFYGSSDEAKAVTPTPDAILVESDTSTNKIEAESAELFADLDDWLPPVEAQATEDVATQQVAEVETEAPAPAEQPEQEILVTAPPAPEPLAQEQDMDGLDEFGSW